MAEVVPAPLLESEKPAPIIPSPIAKSNKITNKVASKSKLKNNDGRKLALSTTPEAVSAQVPSSALSLAPAQIDPMQSFLNNLSMKDYPAEYPEQLKINDKKSFEVWKRFKPTIIPGESTKFAIKYFGVTCGIITLTTMPTKMIGPHRAYHLLAKMKSAPFYRYLYTVDDTIESFIDEKSFLPLKYTLIQRESGQSVDDLQLFDHDKLKGHFWFERMKKGELTKNQESTDIPKLFQDSYSALHFVRGLPLNKGEKFEFPILTRGKLWILKAEVGEVEKIKVLDQDVDAIKIRAETHFPGVLKKKGDILFWYSAGPDHKLLKFMAKVKIGTIEGEVTTEDFAD